MRSPAIISGVCARNYQTQTSKPLGELLQKWGLMFPSPVATQKEAICACNPSTAYLVKNNSEFQVQLAQRNEAENDIGYILVHMHPPDTPTHTQEERGRKREAL